MLRYFLFLFALISSNLYGQSLTGTNGLFKVPSAFVGSDGQAYIGASIYPKGFYELFDSGDLYTGMPTFMTLSLYGRIEVMFRYTHQLGQVVNYQTRYFPDRMFSLRFNVLREGEYYPAITAGVHDVSGFLRSTSISPWFFATYLVATKTIESSSFTIVPTVGFSFDVGASNRSRVFNGFLAGIELTYNRFPNFIILGEYDSMSMNIALKTTVLDHLHFAFGLLDMKAPSAFFTYRFNLLN